MKKYGKINSRHSIRIRKILGKVVSTVVRTPTSPLTLTVLFSARPIS